MHTQPQTDFVKTLASRMGYLRSRDLAAYDIPRVVLTRMTNSGELFRAGRGVYRLSDSEGTEHEQLAIISTRTPHAVICLLSALAFHELTTQLPWKNWIAIPTGRKAKSDDSNSCRIVHMSPAIIEAGVEYHNCDGVQVKVFSIEKTIVDCFRFRRLIGLDVALEAMHDARRDNRADVNEIWRYAKLCRVTNAIRPYLESFWWVAT